MKTSKEEKELEKEIEESETKLEKKKKRNEGVEKRKSLKQKDKIARWSGFILLLMVLILGFVLWVAGEMGI